MAKQSLKIPDNVHFNQDAFEDLKRIDGSVRTKLIKQIIKVASNPVSKEEGGYGIPLGNKDGRNLTGYFEIKLLKDGIRCIYKCKYDQNKHHMEIIVISARKDEVVYQEAYDRIKNYT